MITQGQPAPDFTLPRDGGTTLTLSTLRPAPVVLFTYGGDGTPTCTNEVMEFNALHGDFATLAPERPFSSTVRIASQWSSTCSQSRTLEPSP